MRLLLALSLLFLAAATPLRAQEDDAPAVVSLDPSSGEINVDDTITVTFPAPMVATDKIDAGGQPSPITFLPAVQGEWTWKSATDGRFVVKAGLAPAKKYRVVVTPGLRDLAGKPVVQKLDADFNTKAFTAKSDWEERKRLGPRPLVEVEFTWGVDLSDAAERIYFQDRESFARVGAEVNVALKPADALKTGAMTLRIAPRDALAVGRGWDLILDGVRAKTDGSALSFLTRIPVGTTRPMTVQWLGGFNLPREKPRIVAKFSDEIEPDAAAKAVTLEPAVRNLKVRADRDDLVIEGDFDLKQRYRVRIAQDLKGVRGYSLAAASSWTASFRAKEAAVFFPAGAVLRQRAGAGLNFALVQTNTGPITWRLAPVPFEKFAEIEKQLREFDEPRLDPVTKEPQKDPRTDRALGRETEPFVEAFALQAVANGEVPALTAAEGEETLRRIAWDPAAGTPPLAGLYVLEAVGLAADGSGRKVGNRCLVSFSDVVLTQKRTPYGTVVRAARMDDGRPVSGARVRLVNAVNHRLLEEATDAEGMATLVFDAGRRPKGEKLYLLATAAEGNAAPAVQSWDAPPFADSVSGEREIPAVEQLRAATLTDRNLYRPGQTVKIKGFARRADGLGGITGIPAGKPVQWRVTSSGSPVAEGRAVVGAEGGWEAEWQIPKAAKLGEHSLEVTVGGVKSEQTPPFRVAEFKVPLFEVEAQAITPAKPGDEKDARVRVASRYFSGQPNAGAKVRWKAKWRAPEDMGGEVNDPATDTTRYFRLLDRQSENAGPAEEDAETKGDTTLGADGTVEIAATLPAPFQGPRYAVDWEITVTSAEGQAVSPNDDVRSVVMRQPALLGINLNEPLRRAAGKDPVAPLDLAWFDRDQKTIAAPRDLPAEADVEWFRISTKTVKEKLAPFTFAYRNAPQFNPAGKFKAKPGTTLDLPAAQPGRYVAVVRAPGMRAVSSEVIVTGLGEDEVPVRNDSSLDVLRVSVPKGAAAVGAKAELAVRSPITGSAWVSVESEGQVLRAWTMPVGGNTSSLEIPIEEAFAPNARVAVYLLSPGGAKGVPQERFGATELSVRQPAWELEVRPKFDAKEAMPGETVRGVVEVRSEGKAVADADLTLYAVDDAILALGQWKPLDLGGTMRPPRTARVRTLQGLDGYVSEWNEKSQFQKGFIIGGGGRDNERPVRKDFKALAYWKTGVRTDAQGKATFDFPAPDSLTRYRFVAVAQTRRNQFGVGMETVEISRPLIAEPALPRFVRQGDEVELRAVVRLGRSGAKPGPVTVRLNTDEGLKIDGPATLRQEVKAGDPTVFVFRARAAESGEKTVIRFAATSDADGAQTDDVEVTLPMESPLRLRREDKAGMIAAGGRVGSDQMPAAWRAPGAKGTYETIVSTSPHLSRLLALPALLDYPHGCFEQRGTRALAHALFTDLTRSLPPGVVDTDKSRDALLETLALYDRFMRYNGRLPYWPNGAGGDDEDAPAGPDNTNSFVTALAAWVTGATAKAGIPVPERLGKLAEATKKIAEDAKEPAAVRVFAAYALTAAGGDTAVDPGTFEELNRRRAEIGDDGRALLALALHARKLMAKEKDQLLREIAAAPEKERAFDPITFSSTPRTSAMVLCALNTCAPAWWTADRRNVANAKLLARMDDLGAFSTQENLWALLAFRTVAGGAAGPVKLRPVRGGVARISADGTAALLPARPLAEPASAEALVPPGAAISYVLRAAYTPPPGGDVRRDGGIRLERVVRNLSDPARDGSPGKPFQAGDRLLVSWRMFTPKVRNYVALEDELPAGVEMVNPDLKMVADYYQIEEPADAKWAALSFVERRDQRTRLYFDRLAPGATSYSALARVTTGGSFRWPGAWASPMYDPRSFGESPGADVKVK